MLAAGPAGIALGGIMRAVDPGREVSALLAIVADAPVTLGRDRARPLVRQPDIRGRLAGLPEHVDRHATPRIPIAGDTQNFGLSSLVNCLPMATVQSS